MQYIIKTASTVNTPVLINNIFSSIQLEFHSLVDFNSFKLNKILLDLTQAVRDNI